MKKGFLIACLALGGAMDLSAQQAYFIDGYHGGIYGHVPPWQTRFMVDELSQFPDWKINLELEPESWDTIEVRDKAAYDDFVKAFANQSSSGRIEYINPAYGQSYMYNISGESIIRQFYYGMRKLRAHFPNAVFTTYSSEEPCFTSALPQILRSYGFKYASLKNPNTCWGGYTRAYGGELVNWIGPDGSSLVAVPRYAVEALKPKSTWETIASNNSIAYVTRAFGYGIRHPVGMCLQDAGWANGPWIKEGASTPADSANVSKSYSPTVFETWRGYIEHRSVRIPDVNWRFSQEDVLTSLVWGGQVLQRIARQVRAAENKIVITEKLAAMATLDKSAPWPETSLDEAWRTLLLSQHHDCWIVPYNMRSGITWADNVARWTGNTNRRCESIREQSMAVFATPALVSQEEFTIRVFNTTAGERDECVSVPLPVGWDGAIVMDSHHHVISGQEVMADTAHRREWLFPAAVPSMGYATYFLRRPPPIKEHVGAPHHPLETGKGPARASLQKDGTCQLETDLYRLIIDPAKGGAIESLIARQMGDREFVDQAGARHFGELRGNFYSQGGFRSSTETPAHITILENGPLRVKAEIRGMIADAPFIETLTLVEGQRRMDIHLEIDWTHNTGIGEDPDEVKGHPLEKAFYNDSFKLQALFPANLNEQKIYKNAPYDVLQSRLANTFFNSWDSIKNVVLLNWVDVADGSGRYGLALLSDHTTSYSHGGGYPLALTIQYSGAGLFYRDYAIDGPSELNYALIPHKGRWDEAGISTEGTHWNEPLQVGISKGPDEASSRSKGFVGISSRSVIQLDQSHWEISSMTFSGPDLCVRLFNAEGDDDVHRLYFTCKVNSVMLVNLSGQPIQRLPVEREPSGRSYTRLSMPRFGIRTLRFIHAR